MKASGQSEVCYPGENLQWALWNSSLKHYLQYNGVPTNEKKVAVYVKMLYNVTSAFEPSSNLRFYSRVT